MVCDVVIGVLHTAGGEGEVREGGGGREGEGGEPVAAALSEENRSPDGDNNLKKKNTQRTFSIKTLAAFVRATGISI